MTKSYSHHAMCDPFDCEKAYCSLHRLIYFPCVTAVFDREERKFFGDGECPACVTESERRRAVHRFSNHEGADTLPKQQGANQ